MKKAKNFKKIAKKKLKKCKKKGKEEQKHMYLQKQAPCECNAGRRCRRG